MSTSFTDVVRARTLLERARRAFRQLIERPPEDLEQGLCEALERRALTKTRDELSERVKREALNEFRWNNRTCFGTELHTACLIREDMRSGTSSTLASSLPEKVQQVVNILDHDPGRVDEVFYWISKNLAKEDQLCTGTALHLAASRGDKCLVELLLTRKADLGGYTTRAEKRNYDVLHAAIYREGRGGACDSDGRALLRFLFSSGADVFSLNANGLSCMHVAFQTGDLRTIEVLRDQVAKVSQNPEIAEKAKKMLATDDLEKVDFSDETRKLCDRAPLEIGILWRKMNKEDLAKAAPKGMGSLRVFIHCAPECIPIFMKELMCCRRHEIGHSLQEMKDKLSSKDIAQLLHEFPEAAASILACVTNKPIEQSPGWHPLPSRVDFASRSWLLRAMGPLIQPGRFRCLYESDREWLYDDALYEAPAWHAQIEDMDFKNFSGHWRPKVQDAKVQVCSIPNIITPSFFSAVLDACSRVHPSDPALFLFKCTPIRAAVSYTFWNGAIWVDVTQFLVSLWGLLLLLLETCIAHEAEVSSPTKLHQTVSRVYEPSFITVAYKRGVVADWIVAKGVVDLLLEVAQFVGCLVIREPMTYLTRGNIWDLVRSILPILLLWHYDKRILQTCIVFIYWMRLLEGVTYSERIGHALLPLHKLATGLLPALTFTLVGFCTLSHAMYIVQVEPQHLWPDHLWSSFTTLITQALPDQPKKDPLEGILLYGGVMFFSIFVMNIFIGVISEQYSNEKQQVNLMFQSLRGSSCLTYLLRMCVLPCDLMTRSDAALLACLCVLLTLMLQTASLGFSRQLPGVWQLFAFICCQLAIFMASIQCKGSGYPWEDFICRHPTPRYLWIMEPADRESEEGQDEMLRECSQVLERRATTTSFTTEAMPNTAEGLRDLVRQAVADVLSEDKRRDSNWHSTETSQNTTGSSQLPTLLNPFSRRKSKSQQASASISSMNAGIPGD